MSFLQECVKQVKPRTENYTPPVDKIQTLLVEGKGASTYFEGVIAACHNYSKLNQKIFNTKMLKDQTVKQFLKAADAGGKPFFATNGKNDKEKREVFFSDYDEALWEAKTIFILDKSKHSLSF